MKRLARSLVYGVLAQAFMLYLAWMVGGEVVGRVVCWNLWIPLALANASMGHGEIVQGLAAPFVVAVAAGILVGVATYSTAIYLALRPRAL